MSDGAQVTPVEWFFYALAAVFLTMLLGYTIAFQAWENAAKTGDAAAVEKYNRKLKGFPRGMYAKMLGKRPR